jgi:hypothetical protein
MHALDEDLAWVKKVVAATAWPVSILNQRSDVRVEHWRLAFFLCQKDVRHLLDLWNFESKIYECDDSQR